MSFLSITCIVCTNNIHKLQTSITKKIVYELLQFVYVGFQSIEVIYTRHFQPVSAAAVNFHARHFKQSLVDDEVPTCSNMGDENMPWEEEFFASINSNQPSLVQEEELDDAIFDEGLPPPKIKCFREAIQSLEDVQAFLDSKGYCEQATTVASALDLVASHCCSYSQSTQDKFITISQ